MNAATEAKLKEYRLAILKNRLLLRLLDEISDTNLHAALIHKARESAALAGMTPYPLLLFSCLFEERTRTVVDV